MDKKLVLQSLLNAFSIWNETTDILAEMEIAFGGAIGANLNQFLPVSLMDAIAGCFEGKIEDREEKDSETGELEQVRYYAFRDSSYRIDDAIKLVLDSINESETVEQCAEKVTTLFI